MQRGIEDGMKNVFKSTMHTQSTYITLPIDPQHNIRRNPMLVNRSALLYEAGPDFQWQANWDLSLSLSLWLRIEFGPGSPGYRTGIWPVPVGVNIG